MNDYENREARADLPDALSDKNIVRADLAYEAAKAAGGTFTDVANRAHVLLRAGHGLTPIKAAELIDAHLRTLPVYVQRPGEDYSVTCGAVTVRYLTEAAANELVTLIEARIAHEGLPGGVRLLAHWLIKIQMAR